MGNIGPCFRGGKKSSEFKDMLKVTQPRLCKEEFRPCQGCLHTRVFMTLLVSSPLFLISSSLFPAHLHHFISFPTIYARPGANLGMHKATCPQVPGPRGRCDSSPFPKQTHLLRSQLQQSWLETKRTWCEWIHTGLPFTLWANGPPLGKGLPQGWKHRKEWPLPDMP